MLKLKNKIQGINFVMWKQEREDESYMVWHGLCAQDKVLMVTSLILAWSIIYELWSLGLASK